MSKKTLKFVGALAAATGIIALGSVVASKAAVGALAEGSRQLAKL